jgi:hypothetical protein
MYYGATRIKLEDVEILLPEPALANRNITAVYGILV